MRRIFAITLCLLLTSCGQQKCKGVWEPCSDNCGFCKDGSRPEAVKN